MQDYLLEEGRLAPSNAAAALIVDESGRYLLQLRDQIPGIFYPGHWGLFGGGTEAGESLETAMRRELFEELNLAVSDIRYFTEFTFDFSFNGFPRVVRRFFEVPIDSAMVGGLKLNEGAALKSFTPEEICKDLRAVPYDAFAVWLHATRSKNDP